MYEKSTESEIAHARPLDVGQVDCTVQLLTVKDGDAYRSMVQFFLYEDLKTPATDGPPVLGSANGKVLVGWSNPLGSIPFATRDLVRKAYEMFSKGVPAPDSVWVESTEAFLARAPEAEALPTGVELDRSFARQWGLSTYVPSSDNPNVYYERPVA